MRASSSFLAVLSLLLLSGCVTLEERFLPAEEDGRVLDNDQLARPASSHERFTIDDPVTLRRGGSVTVNAGFFNVGGQAVVMVAGPDALVGFGEAERENTLVCVGENSYEYTMQLRTPFANVSGFEGVGLVLEFVDDHGIATDKVTCPVAVINVGTTERLLFKDVTVDIID
ncbi:hypothetical protein JXA12_04210 [Candidatus Woesearchaeota archaeon]|nr:hypothetical protein [Candidatus Woesearchaeota archaeon]